jgi:hypothetical protein
MEHAFCMVSAMEMVQLLQWDTNDNSQATELHIKTPLQMYTILEGTKFFPKGE